MSSKSYVHDKAEFLLTRLSVCVAFSDLDCLLTSYVPKQAPSPPTTRTGEEPQLAVAGLSPQVFQHRLWVGAGQPLGLGHGVTPFPPGGPPPSSLGRAAPDPGNGRAFR